MLWCRSTRSRRHSIDLRSDDTAVFLFLFFCALLGMLTSDVYTPLASERAQRLCSELVPPRVLSSLLQNIPSIRRPAPHTPPPLISCPLRVHALTQTCVFSIDRCEESLRGIRRRCCVHGGEPGAAAPVAAGRRGLGGLALRGVAATSPVGAADVGRDFHGRGRRFSGTVVARRRNPCVPLSRALRPRRSRDSVAAESGLSICQISTCSAGAVFLGRPYSCLYFTGRT